MTNYLILVYIYIVYIYILYILPYTRVCDRADTTTQTRRVRCMSGDTYFLLASSTRLSRSVAAMGLWSSMPCVGVKTRLDAMPFVAPELMWCASSLRFFTSAHARARAKETTRQRVRSRQRHAPLFDMYDRTGRNRCAWDKRD